MTPPVLDTSFIVRYLTNDPPEMAEAAARVIDGAEVVAVSSVGIVESAFVLSTVYGVVRERVVDALVELLQRENLRTIGPDKPLMVQALLLCRPSARVSFADAVLWAEARWAGARRIYSFDERFPSEGVELSRGGI